MSGDMSGRVLPSIDVVVPVHGKWAVTESCLRHLARQTVPHRVVVVDDLSPDDTLDRLREHPEVHVVAMERNVGFGRACNAGIRAGTGDVVVLVNNDVDAEPDMLEALVAPFVVDASLGSAAPMLLRPDGRVDAFGICADPTLAGFVREQGVDPADAQTDEPRILGPYGAVAAYRREALDAVGLFDDGIFMYGEELDLALRLSGAGWGSVGVPEARGVHLGGATAGRGSARQRELGGFGRGYLLRAYRVLRTRWAVRAVVTEVAVCLGDLLLSRDLAATRGRLAGWRAGRSAGPRPRRIEGVDPGIGFWRSIGLRRGDYAARA